MSALCGHWKRPVTRLHRDRMGGTAPPSSSPVIVKLRAYGATNPGCPATVPVAVICWSGPYMSSSTA